MSRVEPESLGRDLQEHWFAPTVAASPVAAPSRCCPDLLYKILDHVRFHTNDQPANNHRRVDLIQAFERSIDKRCSAHPPRDDPVFWWQLSLVTHAGPGSGTYLHYVIPFVFSPPSSWPRRTGHHLESSRLP